MRKLLTAALAVLCLGVGAGGVAAEQTEEEMVEEALAFVLHDAIFTLYHEVGHLLVGELNLPVLGKEEDAADALATLWMLEAGDDIDGYNALIDATDSWYFGALESTGSGLDDLSYYDTHSLDIHRAYAMVCMMVGKDPEAFSEPADSYELSEGDRETCSFTYQQADDAWTRILAEHVNEDGEVSDYTIIYDEPGEYEMWETFLRETEIVETVANFVSEVFALPREVTYRVTQCGEPNAYYDPNAGEVIYCYELAETGFTRYINFWSENG